MLWVVVIGGWKTLRRRARYLTRDPRRVATVSRQELEAFLRDQGVAVAAGATLEELRRVVGVELGLDMRAFTTAVARGRFGPPAEAGRDPFAPRRELKALLRAIRFELSGWARFRGLVSSRSLYGVDRPDRDVRPLPEGRQQLRDGLIAQATVSLEKAKRREPPSRSIREALAIAYFRLGRWEEAEVELRALVDLSGGRVGPPRPREGTREPGPPRRRPRTSSLRTRSGRATASAVVSRAGRAGLRRRS